MTRRFVQFTCEGSTLVGTLDETTGAVGLLIVSGGNEIRSGPFAGQADLADEIKERGYPVFRFDRRGVGDSEGENGGFRSSAADIAAAITAFRKASPHLRRIVAYGNCDAASALMLQGGAGCQGLVLSNPWSFDEDDDAGQAAAAVRSRYAGKLRSPGEWKRLLTGRVSLGKLLAGLRRAISFRQPQSHLMAEMQDGMAEFTGKVVFLVSGLDRTGQAFRAGWRGGGTVLVLEGADHAFSGGADRVELQDLVESVLQEQAGQLDMG
ncbi:hydrolase 1, exosortase A system-associated [Aurantiacibacter sp. MUD11]|uniref:hydrolase 1, exosortase A system-associated n=1 Tax=Aurantiacibacter sp. MUD11 TaxID=3003265 RepID=UPI0022AA8FA3|nr:hydrolase 1, exosortase A system-associated [Aurantiacibacter sp. MUD11]WAT18510.1 hydrolase 1, exosortase A system-associated [Aurantiacibacter sp. MUD11]